MLCRRISCIQAPLHRVNLDPEPPAPKQDTMNFESRGLTYKDLSIHKDIVKDTASHIVQYNGAAGDFRLVTVSVALRVYPQLPGSAAPPPPPSPPPNGSPHPPCGVVRLWVASLPPLWCGVVWFGCGLWWFPPFPPCGVLWLVVGYLLPTCLLTIIALLTVGARSL